MKPKLKSHFLWCFVQRQKIMLPLVIFIFFAGQSVLAQNHSVSGSVKDNSGVSVPGATVVVKGTTTGTATDGNGNYSLGNIPADAILQFSFVGMETQEIPVEGRFTINVTMAEDAIFIEEVVAIGYGTMRKKDLTGSVASVGGNTLKNIPVSSAAEALSGRLAGVQVTQTEGGPDAEIVIRVRGGGSITQDNSPLYIVDGFPVDDIKNIAPTDIESIDVLKDASSTAIYGARGANGVILITTKGGTVGKGKISFNSYYGVKKILKTLDVLDPYEYVYWQWELSNYQVATERRFGAYEDFVLYKQMKGTDWQDEVFGRYAPSMFNNLTFSGGDKSSRYNISLVRNDEEYIMIGSGYERTNLTLKTFHQVNNWLSLDLNTRLSDKQTKGAGTYDNGLLLHALQYRPVAGFSEFVDAGLLENPEDYDTYNADNYNPVGLTENTERRTNSTLLNISGAANIKFTKNLTYRLSYGYQKVNSKSDTFYGPYTGQAASNGKLPLAYRSLMENKSYSLANTLTFQKKGLVPGHNLSLLLGQEMTYSQSVLTSLSAKFFPENIDSDGAFNMFQLGTNNPISLYTYPDNKLVSFFGRINYDFKGKYLLAGTVRADGSSKFAPGNQWGYFPSASFGWRVSQEPFMKNTVNWLSDLKLRASYGASGNNRISDNAWQKTFSIGSSALAIGGTEDQSVYLIPNSILSNSKLKWETTISRNIGIDYALFKQRISGSLDLYKNNTKDLLISATIPSNTGYTKQWQNIGETSNRGLEFVLNTVFVQKKDFSLSASFNIAFNRNKIENLGEAKEWMESSGWPYSYIYLEDFLVKEGSQVGEMYGYETDADMYYSFDDFNYDPETESYTLKEGVPDDHEIVTPARFWPGTLKLVDQNGDGVVDKNDKKVIGNANPKHTGGFSLNAQYKGFDMSALFNWVYGNNIMNAMKIQSTGGYYYTLRNMLNMASSDKRFTYYDQGTGELVSDPVALAEMNKDKTMWSTVTYSRYPVVHSWAIEDGSFLRLSNLTIGYSIPDEILRKLRIQKLRVYATASNLWTWTKYSGYDPEVSTRRSTPLTPGVDWCAYPKSRMVNVGINLEF